MQRPEIHEAESALQKKKKSTQPQVNQYLHQTKHKTFRSRMPNTFTSHS